ncbi:MAG: amidophosphoribosyltransferase [Endozoicomonadaceae bacterium]|nr:amidophosphoribosyltransferase [Endozoicomonadaceae bacterium]
MCGVIGLLSSGEVLPILYEALTVLQHRGQDAAGIATCSGNHFHLRKSNGLIRDIFYQRHMKRLEGFMGIGHTRYSTTGSTGSNEVQPLYVNSPYGIMFSHNGNLTNYNDLREELIHKQCRHINTSSDTEILLNVFAHELQKQSTGAGLTPTMLFNGVKNVFHRCQGGYAVVALISGHGLLAFRDPHGIRPLMIGRKKNTQGDEFMVASESVALDAVGFEFLRDVAPGEAIFIDRDSRIYTAICAKKTTLNPCLFEYIYMARPDSVIDKISVYQARLLMGKQLAKQILKTIPIEDIDVVIPIPDSGRPAALEVSRELKLPYREGFVKNRYIGRTFIMSEQSERISSVRRKLNAMKTEFKDKNILLVDDSIVRGTTCKQLIELARESGAKKVYFCSASPPIRHPNVYGIDIPSCKDLVAYDHLEHEIAVRIGADQVIYQKLDELVKILKTLNPNIVDFEASVFNGIYITGKIDQKYFELLQKSREKS